MKYVASYLLATIGGNASPSATDLEKILGSVGVEYSNESAELVVKLLNGKDVNEVIAEGQSKLASVPSGGAVAASAAAPAASAPAGGAPAAAAKKEEKKEESEEEDMGFGLFD